LIFLLNGTGNTRINLIVEESLQGYGNIDLNIVSIYTVGKAIGNGLGNNGDSIYLYDLNGNLIFEEIYDGNLANGDGNALCFSGGVFACIPSPGIENSDEDEENNSEGTSFIVEESENYSGHSYIKIDYVENPSSSCESIQVNLMLWNNKNKKGEIQAYIKDVNVVSRLKINPQNGQTVELPVATCNGSIPPEGEYVLVVEGFGERDMRLIWLRGLVKNVEEETVNLANSDIENNINTLQESLPVEMVEKSHEGIRIPDAINIAVYLVFAVIGLGTYYVLFKV
jgi:hypothetical protein